MGLHGEHHLRLGRTAHVALGHVVGIDHVAVDAGVGDAVDTTQVIGAAQVHSGLEGAVAAAVEHHPRLTRRQRAVSLDPAPDGHGGRVPRIARHQFLDVVHDHLDWTARVQREVIAQRHVHERPLAAEVSAYAARVQHDALLVHPPDGGQLLPQGVGVLVVDPDLHPSGLLGPDDAGMGLDVGLVHQLRVEGVLQHQVGLGEAFFNFALAPGDVGEYVVDARLRLR